MTHPTTDPVAFGFKVDDVGFIYFGDGSSREATAAEQVMWAWMLWAQAEVARLRGSLKDAGAKVFGGGWIDHAVDCPLGESDESICSCGLTDWLKKNEQDLGIQLGGERR